jgi:hypothetical protein
MAIFFPGGTVVSCIVAFESIVSRTSLTTEGHQGTHDGRACEAASGVDEDRVVRVRRVHNRDNCRKHRDEAHQ